MKSTMKQSPCNPFPDCEHQIDDNRKKKHTLKDKKGGSSKLLIENPDKKYFHIVNIDGCFEQKIGEEICDFMVLICENETAFLIELKGGDFSKARNQLIAGLEKTKQKLLENKFNISGRIILTNTNAVKSARVNEILQIKNLFKKVGGNFDFKGQAQMELKI